MNIISNCGHFQKILNSLFGRNKTINAASAVKSSTLNSWKVTISLLGKIMVVQISITVKCFVVNAIEGKGVNKKTSPQALCVIFLLCYSYKVTKFANDIEISKHFYYEENIIFILCFLFAHNNSSGASLSW